jgi:transposase InsO family protein
MARFVSQTSMSACSGVAADTKAQARTGVTAWIEDYNTIRRHSALDTLSPVQYEQALAACRAA